MADVYGCSRLVNRSKTRAKRPVLLDDRRIKVALLASEICISNGSVHTIILEYLGMSKVFGRRVPRNLNMLDAQLRRELLKK